MNNYQQQNGPWFVHLNGSSVGPLPVEELRSLAQRTVVNEETMVSVDGRNWQRAAHAIPGLFASHATGTRSGNVNDYFKPGEQWFVNTYDGKQYGPVAYTELMSWIVGKTLTPSCLVRRESDPQWHRVGDVFGENKPMQAMAAAAPRPSYIPPQFPQAPSPAPTYPQPSYTPPPSSATYASPSDRAKQSNNDESTRWAITIGIVLIGVVGFFALSSVQNGGARNLGRVVLASVIIGRILSGVANSMKG